MEETKLNYEFTHFYSNYTNYYCIGTTIHEPIGISIKNILLNNFNFRNNGCEVLVGTETNNYGSEFNFIISSSEESNLIRAEEIFHYVVREKYGR